MARYIDGYVVPIAKKNVKMYQQIAKKASRVWLDHGALEYRECVGDDINAGFGLPFPRIHKLKSNETLIFAWIVYKSKAHRDRVNKKAMQDPRLDTMVDPKNPPFDSKRMAYGGFETLVDAKKK